MSYSDLALERERLDNEDNLLDETNDETVEFDKRREYVRILMEKKFPEIGDKETSFINRPEAHYIAPDQTTDFVAQKFMKEKYGVTTIDGDTLMGIRLKYEIAPKTGNLRLKKSFASKTPVVLNKKSDGTYEYNETPTNANFVKEFKKLVENVVELNDLIEKTPSIVSSTNTLEWDYEITEVEKRGVVDGLRPEEVRELRGALLPNDTTTDRLEHLKILRDNYVEEA